MAMLSWPLSLVCRSYVDGSWPIAENSLRTPGTTNTLAQDVAWMETYSKSRAARRPELSLPQRCSMLISGTRLSQAVPNTMRRKRLLCFKHATPATLNNSELTCKRRIVTMCRKPCVMAHHITTSAAGPTKAQRIARHVIALQAVSSPSQLCSWRCSVPAAHWNNSCRHASCQNPATTITDAPATHAQPEAHTASAA